jgi:hypothetical protein
MFHELADYIWALKEHWVSLVTGGGVIAALTMLERKWKQINWTRWRWLTWFFLLWATFLAWSDERERADAANAHLTATESSSKDSAGDARLWHARAEEKEKTNDALRRANDDLRHINGEQALLLNKRPTPLALSVAGGRSPEETAKRRALRNGLSKLLIRGQELMKKCESRTVDVPNEKRDEWVSACLKFIQENQTDTSFEARFRSPQSLGRFGIDGTEHNEEIWNELHMRTRALTQLIEELRD